MNMKYYVPAWLDESIGMSRPVETYRYGLFPSPEEAWMFCLKDANNGTAEREITVCETDDIMDSVIFVTYSDRTFGTHFVKEASIIGYFKDQSFVTEYISSMYVEIEETYGLDCCDDELGVWLNHVAEVAPGAFKLTFVADWNGGHDVRDLVYIYVEDEYYERGDNKDIDKYFDMEETA